MEKLVIIGAGMSGVKFAAELSQRSRKFDITLICEEPYAGYNRILLSPLLAGEKALQDVFLYDDAWYDNHRIRLLKSCRAASINTVAQQVMLDQGDRIAYDKLIIATGSLPFILPIGNNDAVGVISFRTIADVEKMLEFAHKKNKAAVIGGGLLGLEAANALANQGMQVTVVHACDSILERQLNPEAARYLEAHFQNKGIDFRLKAFSKYIHLNSQGEVRALEFNDGSVLETDMVVMAVGVRPNIALAQEAGLACEKGILVDETMQTSAFNVYAIGECVQFGKHLFGLVAPVYEQARALADNLIGETTRFCVQPTATKLKVSGVNLFSAGDINDQPDYEYLIYRDPAQSIYKRLSVQDGRLKGVVLYGDVVDGSWYFDLLMNGDNINAYRKNLVFGKRYCHE